MKRLSPGMIAALLLCFFAFAAGEIVSRTVFERLPHLEDEFAYYYQAKIFAGGHWYVERDAPVKVFWQPFVIQPENAADGIQKRFGKYTPGWPLLLSLGVLTGTPWLVNAFIGMLIVALVYRIASEIFDETIGVVSALLMAISPMAILLNGTMMSHPPSMLMAAVFVYAYWRVTRSGKRHYAWAAMSGLALGALISMRPLSAIAIAAPVMLHALSRLMDSTSSPKPSTLAGSENIKQPSRFVATLKPLLVLSMFVLPTAVTWPLANYIWTGNPTANTYLMLWNYDKPGFGPGYGLMAGGHTLEYGLRNTRTDLEVYLRDLFGFSLNADLEKYMASNLGWGAGVGLSWILIAAGLFAGRKREWIWLFFEIFIAIVIAGITYWIGSVVHGTAAYSLRYWYEATFAMAIVGGYGAVAIARALRGKGFGVLIACAVIYLIGWFRFRASDNMPDWYQLAGLALIAAWAIYILATNWHKTNPTSPQSATKVAYLNGILHSQKDTMKLPVRVTTFAQKAQQAWLSLWPGYLVIFAACAASLIGYTPARFNEPADGWPNGLFRYNKVGQHQVQAINEARAKYGEPGQPVLIVILRDPTGAQEDNWRNYGAAMAMTSPYLNSDVVVARVFEPDDAPEIVQRFPGRLVLYQIGETLYKSIHEAINGTTQGT